MAAAQSASTYCSPGLATAVSGACTRHVPPPRAGLAPADSTAAAGHGEDGGDGSGGERVGDVCGGSHSSLGAMRGRTPDDICRFSSYNFALTEQVPLRPLTFLPLLSLPRVLLGSTAMTPSALPQPSVLAFSRYCL